LHSTKAATAEEAAKALLQTIGRVGQPVQILSDNGSHFVNKVIQELTTVIGTEKVNTMAYSKEENSMVERSNREAMRHLRNIIFDQKIRDNWSTVLPLVQRIQNANTIKTIGASPAQILFGNAITLDRGLLLPFKEIRSNIKLSTAMATMLQLQKHIINIAQQTQAISDNTHYARADPYRTEYEINSYVIAQYENENHKPPDKLTPLFQGPYRIVNTNQDNKNVYTVQNLLTNQLEDFHVTNLRPFIYDAETIGPVEVAILAKNLTRVAKIVRAKGPKQYKTKMQFLVQLEGFDSKHNSWLAWDELRDNPVFT
jgi:hypothetical protein